MTTKNKPKKINTLKELIAEINKTFEMIDHKLIAQSKRNKVQDDWNKNFMNEQKKIFNYLVELDGIIKEKLKGGKNEKNDTRG